MAALGQVYYRICEAELGHRLARSVVGSVRRLGALRGFRLPLDCLSLSHDATRELMRLWRNVHWSSGEGMMPPDQLLAIYRLACNCRAAGDVVELGAWTGLTTCYLAAACRVRGQGHVYAVDTFEGIRENNTRYSSIEAYGGSTLRAFRRRIERAGVVDLVTACVDRTVHAASKHRGHVAFLLVDADHSYRGVKADFEAWLPRVSVGGLIAFHDYDMPDANVREYVDREVVSRRDVIVRPGQVADNIFAVTRTPMRERRRTERPSRFSAEDFLESAGS